MAFRNPLYLDGDLLTNLADYFGRGAPEQRDVTRRTRHGGAKGGGSDKGVVARVDSSTEEEWIETYSITARPVRSMNDLLDHLHSQSLLVRPGDDAGETVRPAGSIVEIAGELTSATLNEVGSIMGRFLPLLLKQAGAGAADFSISDADGMRILADSGSASGPQLFDVDPDVDLPRTVALVDPKYLMSGNSLDYLEGEFTLAAVVDRLVRDGASTSWTASCCLD